MYTTLDKKFTSESDNYMKTQFKKLPQTSAFDKKKSVFLPKILDKNA